MSDTRDEAEGLGAADPVTGITAAKDDLDADAQLADPDVDDQDSVAADAGALVTNDAVAGETVAPGAGDGNDGPTGGSPTEATPLLPENELAGQDIDLDDGH